MFLSSTGQNNPYNYPLWKDTRKLAGRNQNFIHWNAMPNKILWGTEEMILIKETDFSKSVRSWFLIPEKVGTSFTSEMAQSSFFFFYQSTAFLQAINRIAYLDNSENLLTGIQCHQISYYWIYHPLFNSIIFQTPEQISSHYC